MSTRIACLRLARLGGFALALAAASSIAASLAPEEMTAARVTAPPQIDGDLSDPAWRDVPGVENFVDPESGAAPFRAVRMKALYDDRFLYLAVWCAEPQPAKIKAVAQPDENVWQDDSLEVFVRHTNDPREYVQLITNTRDVHEDHMNVLSNSPGKQWSSTWSTRTQVGADSWTTEMRIPLEELGVKGPPLAGDFLTLKLAREIWSDFKAGDPAHPARLAVWPAPKGRVGTFAFGRVYFNRKDLLQNADFTGTPDARKFYPGWGGNPEAPALFTVRRSDGEAVVEVNALKGAAVSMHSGVAVQPDAAYQARAEIRGAAGGRLQVRVRMAGHEGTVALSASGGPSADWTPIRLDFSSHGATAEFSFSADGRGSDGTVSFRRIEIVKQDAGAKPYALTWQVKEPLPRHGLDALAARRFGFKPYDLLAKQGISGERTAFRDTSTGIETWLMTRDRANESHIYHNLVWAFSFNGKWFDFASDRPEVQGQKFERWAAATDGSAVFPLVKERTQNHFWCPWDGDLYDYDAPGAKGQFIELNVATGARRVLAELGPWLKPAGIIARPGSRSPRWVVVYPDKHTGFTIKRDGSARKEVRFEPADGRGITELYFSESHPDILYARDSLYRLAADGDVARIGAIGDARNMGFGNLMREGHGDISKSELYRARPDGTVTDPEGKTEKVYDPSPYRHLGGNIGQNGYASWGPTDDWFIVEDGQHFVQARRDGLEQNFLGFHFAESLDYNSMAWGQASPDGTKIVCKTTMFDNTDMMLMIVDKPRPPARVAVKGDALAWEPPALHAETKGYLVYAGEQSGGPYRQATASPVPATTWPLPKGDGKPAFYVVTAVEQSGLESPFSREAEAGVAADAPAWIYAEAESLDRESPVVERRDMSASDWHFVAQDPFLRMKESRDGALIWRCMVPPRLNGAALALWARVRKAPGGRGATAQVINGKTEAQFTAESESWSWARATGADGKPMAVQARDGMADIRIALQSAALDVDMLALTNDLAGQPRPCGNADVAPPPAPVELRGEPAGAEEALLAWRANSEPDVAYYNVYASPDGTVSAVQKYRVGSPSQARFVDWGLRAGAEYRYVVTAVDRAGNESAPSAAVSVRTRDRATDRLLLEAEAAKIEETGAGESVVFTGTDKECSGGRFVGARVPGAEAMPLAKRLQLPAKRITLTWKFTVRTAGDYEVWLRLRSRDSRGRHQFFLDGASVAQTTRDFGWYDARAARSMWGEVEKAYRWFWTNMPLYRQRDPQPLRLALTAGEHELKLANITPGLDVDAVMLTNDYSWIPEGTLNYF